MKLEKIIKEKGCRPRGDQEVWMYLGEFRRDKALSKGDPWAQSLPSTEEKKPVKGELMGKKQTGESNKVIQN